MTTNTTHTATYSRSRFSAGRISILLAAILALVLFIAAMSPLCGVQGAAWANNDGTDSYMRVNDFSDTLSEAQEKELSDKAKAEVAPLQFDFVVYYTTKSGDVAALAKQFYEQSNCGFGEQNDGIILCYNPVTKSVGVYACGLGSVVFSDFDMTQLHNDFLAIAETDAYEAAYDFLRSTVTRVAFYRGTNAESRWPAHDTPATNPTPTPAPGATTQRHTVDELSWYPSDPSKFVEFHDENAPRVVDNADILTDEQEAKLLAHINDMRTRIGIDFVLMTDNSSYGLSRELYAADFYRFNGYGVGDKFDGVIYFVCMEPGNRGFVTLGCGNAQKLISEKNLNTMDDQTYDLFKSGKYYKAIETEFDLLDTLYTNNGFPIDWTPFNGAGIVAIIIGLIAGSTKVSSMRKKMKTISEATRARTYIVEGPVFSVKTDEITGHHISRTKHVEHDSSGGGGGSSFSSGFSGSGGGSHSFSGGGRSF